MINLIKRLAESQFVRKFVKYSLITLIIYAAGYMFNLNYMMVNSNGLHGIVARDTFNALIDDHAKAAVLDSITVGQYLMGE